jgi:hypothetical protein
VVLNPEPEFAARDLIVANNSDGRIALLVGSAAGLTFDRFISEGVLSHPTALALGLAPGVVYVTVEGDEEVREVPLLPIVLVGGEPIGGSSPGQDGPGEMPVALFLPGPIAEPIAPAQPALRARGVLPLGEEVPALVAILLRFTPDETEGLAEGLADCAEPRTLLRGGAAAGFARAGALQRCDDPVGVEGEGPEGQEWAGILVGNHQRNLWLSVVLVVGVALGAYPLRVWRKGEREPNTPARRPVRSRINVLRTNGEPW